MKKIFSHLLVGAAFILGVGVAITPASAETLYDAVEGAVSSHPSVTGAQAAKDASVETIREQRSSYFPELSANATGGRVYGDNATSRGLSVTRGAGYSGFGEGSASVTQRIYDWGETSNKVDAARARDNAAQLQVTDTRETVGLHAAQAYIALLRATRLKDAGAENLKTIQGYQQKIATQVKEGGSDEAELNRANDFLLLAQNAATEFEGQYQQAMADFIEATGSKPSGDLKRPAMPGGLPASVDKAIQAALADHPQVATAKEAIVAAQHDTGAESTMYLPKISAQASYLKRDEADIIGGEAVDGRAVLKADWNYSTGGAQLARVARARAAEAQAQAQLDATYRGIERNVRVSWSALDVVRQQEKTQADRKDATAKVVDTYKTQYEGGGERKLIELMQAESQAFDAGVAYDNADYGVLNASYTLLAAMGQLVSGVKSPVAVVDAPVAATKDTVQPAVAQAPVTQAPVKSMPIKETSAALPVATESLLMVPSTANAVAPAPVVAPVQKAAPVPQAPVTPVSNATQRSMPPRDEATVANVAAPMNALPMMQASRPSVPQATEDVLLVPSTDFSK